MIGPKTKIKTEQNKSKKIKSVSFFIYWFGLVGQTQTARRLQTYPIRRWLLVVVIVVIARARASILRIKKNGRQKRNRL